MMFASTQWSLVHVSSQGLSLNLEAAPGISGCRVVAFRIQESLEKVKILTAWGACQPERPASLVFGGVRSATLQREVTSVFLSVFSSGNETKSLKPMVNANLKENSLGCENPAAPWFRNRPK